MSQTPRITLDILRKYDRPGPRYTSYPTAVEFHEGFDADAYVARLAEANRQAAPLSLYTHLPFCEHRCAFCGCHVVITKERAVVDKYLERLHREIDLLAEHLPNRRKVTQHHWGGGTPTHLELDQIEALYRKITGHFELDPTGEIAIEADPRVTTREQIDLLRAIGFNRVSMGIQDFDPDVQVAIDRNQSEAQSRELYDYCRSKDFHSINIDLIYGLPKQTIEQFSQTIRSVIRMRPDRVALYSFAHIPWKSAQQKWIDPSDLPAPELKLALFVAARDLFLDAGYAEIGMDHFAVPEDELATARRDRRLHRNFMGYTVKMGTDMLAVGVSGIGDVQGAFAQNEKKLSTYYAALDAGRFPIERGYALDADDLLRREFITRLMCNLWVDVREVEREFGIAFPEYFAAEIAELRRPDGPVEHGFVEIAPDHVEVLGLGRFFVRNIAMTFDRYLKTKLGEKPMFSRTV
jgi:oxygen-independent coproporphyrinogen-3 oxidase